MKSIYNFGNIVWVNLPKSDNHLQHGIRKALIVSNNKNNENSPNLHIIPLTTKSKRFVLHLHRNNARDFYCIEQLMLIPKEYVMLDRSYEYFDDSQLKDIYNLIDVQIGRKTISDIRRSV